jgi:hypothetical protein
MKIPKTTAEMFPGLLGKIVTAASMCSEAHPAAIAGQFLVGFGNALGRAPHLYVGETRHSLQEFCIIVGPTGTGRKGDAWNVARTLLAAADPEWADNCLSNGLSSGEGLIHHVRDAVEERDRKTGEPITVDAGVADKRLLVVEPEFSQPLKVARREGNVLSDVLMNMWDGAHVLRTLTKHSPTRATDAHVGVIGHTTPAVLRTHLADLDIEDGFANRFLFLLVNRVRELPSPPRLPDAVREALAEQTATALRSGRAPTCLRRTAAAERHWHEIYTALTAARPGLCGALLARAAAHVTRLSALFAVLAGSPTVDVPHLVAALAWWDYAVASVETIFAGRTGNADADRIKAAMLPGEELTRSTITQKIFANHITAGRLTEALRLLEDLKVVRTEYRDTAGRRELVVTRLEDSDQSERQSAA